MVPHLSSSKFYRTAYKNQNGVTATLVFSLSFITLAEKQQLMTDISRCHLATPFTGADPSCWCSGSPALAMPHTAKPVHSRPKHQLKLDPF